MKHLLHKNITRHRQTKATTVSDREHVSTEIYLVMIICVPRYCDNVNFSPMTMLTKGNKEKC